MMEQNKGSNQPAAWMRFFEDTGAFYLKFHLKPAWSKYDYGRTVKGSATLFLESYAFERQGRDPSFAHAAADAAQKCVGDAITANTSAACWVSFADSLGNRNLNQRNNPLYPGRGGKFALFDALLSHQDNLVVLTKDLVQSGNVQKAFQFLTGIRGIGPKIASFFLRDLKEAFGIEEDKIPDGARWMLQPVDVWVRRTVRYLAGNNDLTDQQVAEFIVRHSKNPERVNMGIWIFSASICGSRYKLEQRLQGLGSARDEREGYLARMKNACDIVFDS